jgi:flagellar hook assembly protein FlgD
VTVPHDQRPQGSGRGETSTVGIQYDATILVAAMDTNSQEQHRNQPLIAKVAGGHMTILFTNETAGPVDLKILDVRGRLVRRLAARAFPAGQHTLYWDGRDTYGSVAATGVYLIRVETASKSHVSKTLWMR